MRRVEAGDDLLFPSDGHFSRVVPLSDAGEEVAPSAAAAAPDEVPVEPEEHEEATLVPARLSLFARRARAPRRKKGVEQSWGFTATVLALSVVAGVAAGAYMIRSQGTAATFRPDAPVEEAAAANGAAEKVLAAEPAERPVPQAPAPQTEHDRLAAAPEPSAATAATAASDKVDEADEADAKAAGVNKSAPTPKAPARAADTDARRIAETAPRAERPARAAPEARDASPAPRLARSDAPPRRADRPAPANAATPERTLPISSPPPSARPKKVIQWP